MDAHTDAPRTKLMTKACWPTANGAKNYMLSIDQCRALKDIYQRTCWRLFALFYKGLYYCALTDQMTELGDGNPDYIKVSWENHLTFSQTSPCFYMSGAEVF